MSAARRNECAWPGPGVFFYVGVCRALRTPATGWQPRRAGNPAGTLWEAPQASDVPIDERPIADAGDVADPQVPARVLQ
eukprot:352012-Lingulodinium_polyedra.AAC.1